MIRYFKENRIIIFITLILCITCAIASSFVAVFLQRILDAAVISDMNSFSRELLRAIAYLAVLITFSYLYSLLCKKSIYKLIKTMRKHLYNGVINHSIEGFQKRDMANYLSYFNNDIKIIEDNYLNAMFTILENIVLFLASLVIMIYYSPIIALFTGISIILMITIPSLAGIPLQKKQDNYSKELSLFTNKLKDMLMGFEVIKTYSIDAYSIKKFERSNTNLAKSKYKVDKLFALTEVISVVLSIILQIGVIVLSAYFVIKGKITVGTLLALTQLGASLANPLVLIFDNIPKMQSTKEILNKLNEIVAISDESNAKAYNLIEFEHSIELENISFGYGNQEILKGIDLKLTKGKKYAIVGTNGCGKSTLLKLIGGYFSTYEGKLLYDEKEIDSSNRSNIIKIASIIHQNIYLFNESIQDNICLHNEYSDEDLNLVLEKSELASILHKKDIALDYEVKENGLNLSGGQRQRIAIARALIQKKPLLIIDEGTSAIEQKASYDIEQNLLKDNTITLLTITHNLGENNLKNYDEIIVMNNGSIVEKGSYYELINSKGFFYNMTL